ncbi:hypothetical protein A3H22_01140 [Candidatus Peribacteria bacterium RIFCSPLOWO2_12_FULL_55_15]|nr:MAG: hypothetical protein A2789_00810 [Candidatus Peribacteria bacterium RIFCSPHIGHO2_01_FULL_54_22]OGJ62442.1 MAG: hypothetical protein A3D12_01490 [Candidatus Peribacteria bacterium RIFCSPHIGHO2_02_FULL_55_24]OGJ64337.1 MAG: hypothetical protein A3E47_02445 [Candidatus Peribacteria bacterium RIFCSPHIGHO2_12_FULL_54_10]OGJ68771.1 MAG: hypothetical protein A2947_02880 [Candidatus Peribacteria bacterium RIFCSPLOWO2_01_FULL_54_110]OGJ69980.1 MAG: hypothetical protein A3H90_02980 [Candidatus Pe
MVTALSTPNIAFIKYWGNRNAELRLPATDSLSMTLDSPTVEVTIEPADRFSVQSQKELSPKEVERFKKHLELTNIYLHSLHYSLPTTNYSLTVRSKIPPAIGLASSAAVFSAVAKAYAALLEEQDIRLTDEQVSILARLGSGSAARSIIGGFVALQTTHYSLQTDAIDSAIAVQIAPASHWPLHDIVICPSLQEKEHGSTEGHHLAHTSPHYAERLLQIPRRQQECIDAILGGDFEKLQKVAEEDAWDLHQVAKTSTPSLQYLTEDTHRITREVTALREAEHVAVLYTMDAGPTVHLVCTEDAVDAVKEFAHAQKDCTVFETKVWSGARMVEAAHA